MLGCLCDILDGVEAAICCFVEKVEALCVTGGSFSLDDVGDQREGLGH